MNKNYYVQSIGNSTHPRYCINFHDGIKTYKDGSEFYDLHIVHNKKALTAYINKLITDGYKPRTFGGL
jgi:hypothetical protein